MDALVRIEVKQGGALSAAFDLDPDLISVSSLKMLVEAETGVDASFQKLISRGMILKDNDILSVYSDGGRVMTVFMTEIKKGDDNGKSFKSILSPRKPSDSSSMQKAMAPLANIMAKNPEFLEKMFMSDPHVKAMLEKQPHLRHALSDPKTLQQIFNMSTNRSVYQEAMRGHDRALSNLENIPQGFQHLVQIHKSLADAESMRGKGLPRRSSSKDFAEAPTRTVSKEPFPNPWETRRKGTALGSRAFPVPNMQVFDLPNDMVDGAKRDILERLVIPSALSELDLDSEEEDDSDEEEEDEDFARALSTASLPIDDLSHYAARFHRQLKMMRELGFTDENENIRALLQSGGNVTAAIEWLVSRRSL